VESLECAIPVFNRCRQVGPRFGEQELGRNGVTFHYVTHSCVMQVLQACVAVTRTLLRGVDRVPISEEVSTFR
jgi:hypothetical protein